MSMDMTSNKPYVIRAFYDWISDNGLTPYILVDVNVPGVMVPMAYVNDGQIVLNISGGAVGSISLAGDVIEFTARFGGKTEHLYVPMGAVGAIYAKENGAGTSLAIELPDEVEELEQQSLSSVDSSDDSLDSDSTADSKPAAKKPTLSVVK